MAPIKALAKRLKSTFKKEEKMPLSLVIAAIVIGGIFLVLSGVRFHSELQEDNTKSFIGTLLLLIGLTLQAMFTTLLFFKGVGQLEFASNELDNNEVYELVAGKEVNGKFAALLKGTDDKVIAVWFFLDIDVPPPKCFKYYKGEYISFPELTYTIENNENPLLRPGNY